MIHSRLETLQQRVTAVYDTLTAQLAGNTASAALRVRVGHGVRLEHSDHRHGDAKSCGTHLHNLKENKI